ncbi:hypothetical protein A4X16_06940 [Microbacterium sp. H83]|nr:hypothetical protein A4X16_06940 [Microbacterium sp. H83]
MGASSTLSTLHIGAAGELLTQYKLLKMGFDSARLTTDSGVDLVVYAPGATRATTVQVKTKYTPTPAGGTGRLSLGFTFPHDLRAETLVLVDLSSDRVWLMTRDEALALAQQHRQDGSRHLYWYVGSDVQGARSADDLEPYALELRAVPIFGGRQTSP